MPRRWELQRLSPLDGDIAYVANGTNANTTDLVLMAAGGPLLDPVQAYVNLTNVQVCEGRAGRRCCLCASEGAGARPVEADGPGGSRGESKSLVGRLRGAGCDVCACRHMACADVCTRVPPCASLHSLR